MACCRDKTLQSNNPLLESPFGKEKQSILQKRKNWRLFQVPDPLYALYQFYKARREVKPGHRMGANWLWPLKWLEPMNPWFCLFPDSSTVHLFWIRVCFCFWTSAEITWHRSLKSCNSAAGFLKVQSSWFPATLQLCVAFTSTLSANLPPLMSGMFRQK